MAEQAGLPMLHGYALPSQAAVGDHTYVTSDDGLVWPCWGRSTGGEQICGAKGDSEVANCLSQPMSHAGIVYLVTGVCHQTANRILYPADRVVDRAGGYRISISIWALWGLGLNADIDRRCPWGARGRRRGPRNGADRQGR